MNSTIPATCTHGNAHIACAPCKYPELYRAAQEIATEMRDKINRRAREVKAATPYKAQCILEMLIDLMRKAV